MGLLPAADREAWLQGPSGRCEQVPDGGQPPARLVLLGAPGVGKGTQADLLTKSLRACHLSTGDVFRAAAGGRDCQPSPAMKEALDYMRQGALVPDLTVWEMVRERGACLRCGGGFILDGFPRTVGQAESLKNWMDDEGICADRSGELRPAGASRSCRGWAGAEPARNARQSST